MIDRFYINNKNVLKWIHLLIIVAVVFGGCKQSMKNSNSSVPTQLFREIDYPTPNIDSTRVNELQGIVLHHTAEPTVEASLNILSSSEKKVGAHVVIDTNGTRYIMAKPTAVTYHAGYSVLNGRDSCNLFTLGIEFQGNTLEAPLTDAQILSGVEYLIPILKEYNIPLQNIVTHEMVRMAYKKKYPERKCFGKVDITQEEYHRFMDVLYESQHALEYYRLPNHVGRRNRGE